jgi:hypothetical protein
LCGWQVLYLEHSVESLARGGPWLLGTIAPGISRWWALRKAETVTEIHGGSSRRRLFGCIITMLRAPAPLQGGSSTDNEALGSKESSSPWPGPEPQEFEQQLLTWSQASLPSRQIGNRAPALELGRWVSF